jgi:hypothetical protein
MSRKQSRKRTNKPNGKTARSGERKTADDSQSSDVSTDESDAPLSRWILLSIAIPFVPLLRGLFTEMWFDEAWTVHRYAASSFWEIATNYPDPNNHIGYSLILRCFWLMNDGFICLRLPSFLAALLTLYFVFRLTHRVTNCTAASVAATAWLGLNQVFLNYAVQIRGYSLSMLLSVVLVYLAIDDRNSTATSWKRSVARVFLTTWFLYVLPTNVLILTAIVILIVAGSFATLKKEARKKRLIREATVHLAAVVIAGLLYLPVINEMIALKSEVGFEQASLWESARDLFQSTFRVAWILPSVALILTIGLRGRGSASNESDENTTHSWRHLAIAVLVVASSPFVAAAVLGIAPYGRNFLPIVPLLSVPCGALIGAAVVSVLSRLGRESATFSQTLSLGIVVAASLPFMLSFPERLSDHRKAGKSESLYFLFSAANFDPGLVVERIAKLRDERHHHLCLMSDRAWQNLGVLFTEYGIPTSFVEPVDSKFVQADILMISMQPPNLEQLAKQSGIPLEQLQQLKPFEEVGGFTILHLDKKIKMTRATVAQAMRLQ